MGKACAWVRVVVHVLLLIMIKEKRDRF